MFAFLSTRPVFTKVIATVFMAAQLLGWMTIARADDSPSSTGPMLPTPPAMRRALREFDRFLDHHPLMEDELRISPAFVVDQTYLKENPELNDFLGANPDVLPAIKHYPRYFLFRALLRQADAPLRYPEIAQLKEVFDQDPSIELALAKSPESIRTPAFLQVHPLLGNFLAKHPVLGNVFLPRQTVTNKNL
jgi:hypothetical protein